MSPDPAPPQSGESSPLPTPATSPQLTELKDALVTAVELLRVYATLSRHPRVRATPGSNEIFATCREQLRHDLMMLDEQTEALRGYVSAVPPEGSDEQLQDDEFPIMPPPCVPFPDVEPTDPDRSVLEAVRRAFHLEDFLRQQLGFSLQSAKERHHLKFDLQLKMILLSAQQRCALLEERYGFARSRTLLFRGLRRQTTRFLSRLQGEKRRDLE